MTLGELLTWCKENGVAVNNTRKLIRDGVIEVADWGGGGNRRYFNAEQVKRDVLEKETKPCGNNSKGQH